MIGKLFRNEGLFLWGCGRCIFCDEKYLCGGSVAPTALVGSSMFVLQKFRTYGAGGSAMLVEVRWCTSCDEKYLCGESVAPTALVGFLLFVLQKFRTYGACGSAKVGRRCAPTALNFLCVFLRTSDSLWQKKSHKTFLTLTPEAGANPALRK